MVNDFIQEYSKTNYPNLQLNSIILDIVLYTLLGYSYYFGENDLYIEFSKYALVFLLSRYILAFLTSYETNGKKYFQLNFYIGMFSLVILINKMLNLHVYTQILLIGIYTLLSSMIYGNTVNNLFTVMLVYNLTSLHI